MAYRRIDSKVVVDCDEVLNKEECKDCGICVDYCPTSALSWIGGEREGERRSKEGVFTGAGENGKWEKLLGLLEEKQRELGHIPKEAIEEVAGELGLSVSEVYGVPGHRVSCG